MQIPTGRRGHNFSKFFRRPFRPRRGRGKKRFSRALTICKMAIPVVKLNGAGCTTRNFLEVR